MKRILLALSLLLILSPLAQAQTTSNPPAPLTLSEIISKIPLNTGIAYDIKDNQVNNITTATILGWKGLSLDVGYSTIDKAVVNVAYDIGGLSKLGIDVPIANLIDLKVGMYIGWSGLSGATSTDRNTLTYGPSVSIISVKW